MSPFKISGNRKNKFNAAKKNKILKPGKKSKKIRDSSSSRPKSKSKAKAKESKIISADNLNWKTVDISGGVDFVDGCYGLEEIDGVDVKFVNGKVQFIVKDDSKIKNEDEDENEDENENEEVEKDGNAQTDGDQDHDENMETKDQIESEKVQKIDGHENKNNKKQNNKAKNSKNIIDNEDSILEENELEIQLPKWKSLNLSPYILNGLYNLKFFDPTPIQKNCVPIILQRRDIIGKAMTGSGKTLAYGIPILQNYLNILKFLNEPLKSSKKIDIDHPVSIIFTPTRELAHQIVNHLNSISKYCPLPNSNSIINITGGLSIQKQERLLKTYNPGIIVATPGRILEILNKDISIAKKLAKVDMIVLDEADRLLLDGHFQELLQVLDLFKRERPKSNGKTKYGSLWQTLIFSATFTKNLFSKLNKNIKSNDQKTLTNNQEIVDMLRKNLNLRDKSPIFVDVNPKEMLASQINEYLIECGALERDLYLFYFLRNYFGSILIFTNSIESVKRITLLMKNLKIPNVFSIHSSMIQKQRLRNLENFTKQCETITNNNSDNNNSNRKSCILIATDVAARGLDIPNISYVVHYHIPRSADVYIHRSGRTGRAGKEGNSIIISSPTEVSGALKRLRKLLINSKLNYKSFGFKNDLKFLDVNMGQIVKLKNIVSIANQISESEISNSSLQKEDTWIKKLAEDLDVETEDLEDFAQDDILTKNRNKKENKQLSKNQHRTLKGELNFLLLKLK
ncbi:ATP-dependent RNA helicase [Ascoidea rubescens DSM 1968]|uniref:ATP-dependent RNA helicase n=1 Tax=Ascoidea rubescens DSM 1968 TaxID=1344418 RepID=A0A1D2VRG1_9ASCO|nr:P-loop containing nucleoside triphosphate hydrolase protein [Ascoidea rubescens DSM 1968]ODV64202.1 P-loop containing nucleoside triphosphate hydrolase protein [Ascoidea rubescens DSM 1968]